MLGVCVASVVLIAGPHPEWRAGGVPVGAAQARTDAALAARVQQLLDKAGIEQLLLDYGRHLDSRDFAAYGRPR